MKETILIMLIGNRYQIARQLGAGGMGTVYLATDLETGTPVAVKQLKDDVAADPEIIERFIREAYALRELNHPNIVKVMGSLEENEARYIIMEYVSGGSLRDLLAEQHTVPVKRSLEIMLDLADALTRAHRLQIVHRDLKPDNVLMAEDGTPRLTDFGVAHIGTKAQITMQGMAVGTPDYISPEALSGGDVDARADIWSFGVMLFEMLTGQRPFSGNTISQLLTAILMSPPPDLEALRPDLPIALVDLINRMLVKDPQARIPSIRMVGAELEAILRGGDSTSTMTVQAVILPDDETGRFQRSSVITNPTPTSSSPSHPHNLPKQPTAFVGRPDELAEIERLLADKTTRLITLVGAGGAGKSRIALEAAERVLPRFANGVFFVPLAALENAEFLPNSIADALNFSFASATGLEAQLISYLSEKSLLLVLDNFEHIVDGGAKLVTDILEGAPQVQIIVTSRERLRLRGEQALEIDGMLIPAANLPAEEIGTYAVIKLFLQSAHRIRPDLELNDDTAPVIVRICELVQGLPLGVELAAAWSESLELDEIEQEMTRSLDFLETDLRDVPERHRSLRAVFDYSWNLLAPEEREIFMFLSVFRGGFEREAAQKVSGASLRTLATLVNKSLLLRDPNGRYRLQKILRQFAEELLRDHPKYDEVYATHAAYYASFLNKIGPNFNTRKELAAADQVEVELENIRVAWEWSVEHRRFDLPHKMSYPLLMFYVGRSMLREAGHMMALLADGLEADGQADTVEYWSARVLQCWSFTRMGEYDLGWRYASQAYEFLRQHPDQIERAGDALNAMSYVRMMQGAYQESAQYAQQAAESVGSDKRYMTVWFMGMANLGYAEFLWGNYGRAQEIYEMIINSPHIEQYSTSGYAYYLNNLGEIVRQAGDWQTAQTYFQQAYDIFTAHKMRRGMAFALNNLAGTLVRRGHYEEAGEQFQKSYQLHRDIGDQSGTAHSLSALGNVAMFKGNFLDARAYYQESLGLRRKIGDVRGIGDSLVDLGNVAVALNDYTAAQNYFNESLAIHQQIGEKFGIANGLRGLAQAQIMLDDRAAARATLETCVQLGRELSNNFYLIVTGGVGLAELSLRDGDPQAAREYIRMVLEQTGGTLNPVQLRGILVAYAAALASIEDQREYALALTTLLHEVPPEFKVYAPYAVQRLADTRKLLMGYLSQEAIDRAIERAGWLEVDEVVAQILAE